jgi:quinone-modifying oxidoreductase, subunit QmoA
MNAQTSKPLLVVGAGIAGVTSALEAAEAGAEVVLIEREPFVGGRVLRLNHYFPKLCPPSCGMEINTRRIENNPRVRVLSSTELAAADKTETGYTVTLKSAPRYVSDVCTACGECAKACPTKVSDPFNLGMSETTAARLPFNDAWPARAFIERDKCPDGCSACADACQYGAIDLSAEATEDQLEVSAVVVATGWHPYPLEKLTELGGDLEDVIANVHMERMVSPNGPTGGEILRPSSGEPPKKVAFVQCAGSRDVNHLPYCSAVCCLASLKQAIYVREQLPESEVSIYFIDRRAPGRNEDMLTRVAAMDGVRLVKGKVGTVTKAPDGQLKLKVEDVEAGKLLEETADLVVLATGMEPNGDLPVDLKMDDDGFGLDNLNDGVVVAGVARRPEDVAATVRDATGAAAKAIISAGRRV